MIKDDIHRKICSEEAERKNYYNQLEQQQRGTIDITGWLEWFLDCLGRAISAAESTLSTGLFKAKLWEQISHNPVNERQHISSLKFTLIKLDTKI